MCLAQLLPDARSRQIVSEALKWALENSGNFATFLRDKANRYGHSPNFVTFTNLLDGLERISQSWNRCGDRRNQSGDCR